MEQRPKEQRPNILFITTDQQRRDTLPCYGADFMQTPAIDRLAQEGLVFDHAYAPSPICQPARASFITGQYPSVTGVAGNFRWLREGTPTIARAFNQAGWNTAAIGKMHFHPWDNTEGFTYRLIAEDKRHIYLPDDWTKFLERHGYQRFHPSHIDEYNRTNGAFTSPLPEELHVDGFIGDSAVKWIEKDAEGPFFCWVSFNSPHDPYDPPESFSHLYDDARIPPPIGSKEDLYDKPSYQRENIDKWSNNLLFRCDFGDISFDQAMAWRKKYYGTVSFVDKQVGKIMDALERRGLADDTMVVFSSDHGDLLGDHGLPFKSNFYEGSLGVPLIFWGPGVKSSSVTKNMVNWVDLHTTFLSLAGLPVPEHVQGVDCTPLLENHDLEICNTAYSELEEQVMIQRGPYKVVICSDGDGELYDHDKDPEERKNQFHNPEYAEVREAFLNEIIQRHIDQIKIKRFGGGKHGPIPEREALFEKIRADSYQFDGNIRLR